MSFGQSKRAGTASALGNKDSKDVSSTAPALTSLNKLNSAATFGKDKQKSSTALNNDNDDWGALDDLNEGNKSKLSGGAAKSNYGGFGVSRERDDGRSSMGSNYAGFGITGKRPAGSSGKKRDDEDDLDDLLGDIEKKKGIETTKNLAQMKQQ